MTDTERTAEDVAATFIAQVREAEKSDLLYRDLERDIVLADLIERQQADIAELMNRQNALMDDNAALRLSLSQLDQPHGVQHGA